MGVFGRGYSTGNRFLFAGRTELTEVWGTGIEINAEPYRSVRWDVEAVPNLIEDFGRVCIY